MAATLPRTRREQPSGAHTLASVQLITVMHTRTSALESKTGRIQLGNAYGEYAWWSRARLRFMCPNQISVGNRCNPNLAPDDVQALGHPRPTAAVPRLSITPPSPPKLCWSASNHGSPAKGSIYLSCLCGCDGP